MRRTTLLLFVGTVLVVGAAPASQESAQADAAKLQGVWAIVSVEIEGKPLAMEKLKEARLTVSGKRYSFRLAETRLELTYKLDASATPRAVDLQVTEGPDKGKVYRGIYAFEGDRYTICRTTLPGKDRPTTFATLPKSGFMMVVWKREKPVGGG